MALRPLTLGFSDQEQEPAENPNYFARLTTNDLTYTNPTGPQASSTSSPTLTLPLPENFQFSVASAYEAPFAQGLIQSQGLQNFARIVGISNLVSQSLTAQVWQGTDEVNFQLTFELYARKNPEEEIVQPMKKLMLLAMPDVNKLGLLTPPGPIIDWTGTGESIAQSASSVLDSIGGAARDMLGIKSDSKPQTTVTPPKLKYKNVISLEIGRFLRFSSVVVQQVSLNTASRFTKDGMPMYVSIDVNFKTFVVPVKGDIDGIFFNSKPTRGAVNLST